MVMNEHLTYLIISLQCADIATAAAAAAKQG